MTCRSLCTFMLLLLLLLENAVTAAPEAQVPLRQIGPYVLVDEVYVNGQGPLRFLVDTGAESCAMSAAAARRIGIAPAWRVELVRTSSPKGVELVEAAAANSIRLGGTERHNIEVLLGSAMDQVHRLSPDIDGVLGQSFLRGLDAYTIDNRQGALLLDAPQPRRGRAIGFELENQRPRLQLQVGGRLRHVVLDSGAPELLLVGPDGGLLPTILYGSVYVNNRAKFVILHEK